MKYLITFLLSTFLSFFGMSQNLIGAWESEVNSSLEERIKTVVTFTERHHVWTTYNLNSGDFVSTKGGSWSLTDHKITLYMEFDSKDAEYVDTEIQYLIELQNDDLYIPDLNTTFKRIDTGTPGQLMGAWLMSGRVVNGEAIKRDVESPRKTMKILSGTRFQWIAYDTVKKEFLATGGGTYTTDSGEYTENILFFSRDSSRVGMNLKFNYELTQEGDWHHTGFSSKGDPINETWSLRL